MHAYMCVAYEKIASDLSVPSPRLIADHLPLSLCPTDNPLLIVRIVHGACTTLHAQELMWFLKSLSTLPCQTDGFGPQFN